MVRYLGQCVGDREYNQPKDQSHTQKRPDVTTFSHIYTLIVIVPSNTLH